MSRELTDTTITCKHCGDEDMEIQFSVTSNDVHFYGRCLKCGYSVCPHEEFVGSVDVNDDREGLSHFCSDRNYKPIDDLYLFTNRYKKVSFDQKVIELGYLTKEKIQEMDDLWTERFKKEREEMRKLKNPNMSLYDWRRMFLRNGLDRSYGLMKMNESSLECGVWS